MKDIVSAAYYKDGRFHPKTGLEGDCSQSEIYYEVIRVMENVPVFLADHLERLDNSLSSDRKSSSKPGDIHKGIKQFLEENPLKEGNLKVMACFAKNTHDCSVIIYQSAHSYPAKELYEKGVALKCSDLQRLNPTVKKWNQQLKQKSIEIKAREEVYEVLLTDRQGNITEGSKSNIFFISEGKLFTAPEHLVLPGITRQKVIDICKGLGVMIVYKTVSCSEMPGVQGAFLTGTSPKVLPVSRIDMSGFSLDHEIMKDIIEGYNSLIAKEIEHNQ